MNSPEHPELPVKNQRKVGHPLESITEEDCLRPKRVAVFVVHGMGQQAPFATLDQTADRLIAASELYSGLDEKTDILARTVKLGNEVIQRVELSLPDGNGDRFDVHVYEGYWAPLTEGRVTLIDVLSFFLRAGLKILSKGTYSFNRWMFGENVQLPIYRIERYSFVLTSLFLFSLVVIGVLVSIVASTYLFGFVRITNWPSLRLVEEFTHVAAFYVVCSLIVGGLFIIAYRVKRLTYQGNPALWALFTNILWWVFLCYVFIVVVTAFVLILIWGHDLLLWLGDGRAEALTFSIPVLSVRLQSYLWVVWGALLIIFLYIRGFLIQSFGDVVAYVMGHRLDRFMVIRTEIKEWINKRLYAIYEAKDKDGKLFYDGVGLIGHSLGSVIVYDSLNQLLNDDQFRQSPIDVAGRTKVLATFGSPLDKIAYVFSLDADDTTETREALATSVQPLLQDYARYRRMKWVNIYAERDIIGGKLDFFDNDDPVYEKYRIENIKDEDALIPLLSHNELWVSGQIFKAFYKELAIANIAKSH